MTSNTLLDGLVLTVVSMLTVFAVLSAIWGILELMAKIFAKEEAAAPLEPASTASGASQAADLSARTKNQKAAEIIALVLASEGKTDRKFEIVESKRIK